MGLLSKCMNALIGEPPVSKTATQPGPKLARRNVPNSTQQQTTQRKSTVQSRQTQQLTQPSQSSQLARSSYRAQTQTTARNTSVTTNRSRAQSHANSQPAQKLMPQPMLPAEQIERARNIIGKIEKHELSDEQISAIAGAGHNTLVLAGAGTGKTTTIVGYIAWLLNTGTATPEEILVLSFTKASADEMSSRITQSTGKVIRACTFHSIGLEICRSSTIANRPIIDGHTSNNVVRNALNTCLNTMFLTVFWHLNLCRNSCLINIPQLHDLRISSFQQTIMHSINIVRILSIPHKPLSSICGQTILTLLECKLLTNVMAVKTSVVIVRCCSS